MRIFLISFIAIWLLLIGQIISCSNETQLDCGTHGSCIEKDNSTYCHCLEGYTGEQCDYEQKNGKLTFWLSLIFGGVGADRFYLGYIDWGIGKLVLGLIILTGTIYIIVKICSIRSQLDKEMGLDLESKRLDLANSGFGGSYVFFIICILIVFSLVFIILWLHDWVSLIMHDLDDSNGYPLAY